jgi:hypothetical protein
MLDNIIGAAPPPPKLVRQIIRVLTSEAKTYICFSRCAWGQYIHWTGQRTIECTRDKTKECEGCSRGWSLKWYAYLNVRDITGTEYGFLELTETAARLIDMQLGENKNMRGVRFRIHRTKGGPKGRYIVHVYEDRLSEASLRPEEDPYETLCFLWNCKKPRGQTA